MRKLLLSLVCLGSFEALLAQNTILLDALELNKIEQETGRPQAVGARANLSIAGRKFLNGICTRTESRLYVELDGKTNSFSAEVGVDDRSTAHRVDPVDKTQSTAEFFVIGDGKVLWQSGVMKYGDDSKPLAVKLDGVRELLLKVTGGPGNTHVDWVDARFTYAGARPRAVWSPEVRVTMRETRDFLAWQNEKYPQPRINGAMNVGIRPGTPFYYPVAVSGLRPVTYGAEGLPAGLALDAETGIITGVPTQKGEYRVHLTAANSAGKTERTLKIVVGERLALTPPMGFLSWNVVEGLISETFLKELADAFVELGLRDAGYQYVNMDDCWQGNRDANGRITPDALRFPNGMKSVGDYLHERGLKFGIYSSPGARTCAGYAGSLNFEQSDVRQWVAWGVDYLKYDRCTAPDDRAIDLFKQMGILLETSGRSIVYCGRKDAGAQLWRVGGDLRDQWTLSGRHIGILQSFEKAQTFAQMQEPGGWNDPDMLVVGLYGKGGSGNDLTDSRGCTDGEYRAHMSLWALMSAPLFITVDVRRINPESLETLTNPEVIDVNQDPLGEFPHRIGAAGEQEVWAKRLEDGCVAVVFFNKGPKAVRMKVDWKELGLKGAYTVRDLWQRQDLAESRESFSVNVDTHSAVLVRLSRQKDS